ncbi:MAG: hypothetical protein KGL39_33350 [Patescibacteria group bacterium]|nr:hypothetical protein [Patescibacteria group bacterium]
MFSTISFLFLLTTLGPAATGPVSKVPPPPPPTAPAPTPAPAPAPAPMPTKLKLPADQTVEPGTGYLKIVAEGVDTSLLAFETFAAWDDGTTAVQSEVIGGVLILGIPNREGVVRITAAVSVAGKPPLIASTTVTVQSKNPKAPGPGPAPGAGLSIVPGALLHVNVIGLGESAALRKAIEAAGCKYWPLDSVGLSRRPDLEKIVTRTPGTGGVVIVQDASGKVLVSARVADDAGVVRSVNSARGK